MPRFCFLVLICFLMGFHALADEHAWNGMIVVQARFKQHPSDSYKASTPADYKDWIHSLTLDAEGERTLVISVVDGKAQAEVSGKGHWAYDFRAFKGVVEEEYTSGKCICLASDTRWASLTHETGKGETSFSADVEDDGSFLIQAGGKVSEKRKWRSVLDRKDCSASPSHQNEGSQETKELPWSWSISGKSANPNELSGKKREALKKYPEVLGILFGPVGEIFSGISISDSEGQNEGWVEINYHLKRKPVKPTEWRGTVRYISKSELKEDREEPDLGTGKLRMQNRLMARTTADFVLSGEDSNTVWVSRTWSVQTKKTTAGKKLCGGSAWEDPFWKTFKRVESETQSAEASHFEADASIGVSVHGDEFSIGFLVPATRGEMVISTQKSGNFLCGPSENESGSLTLPWEMDFIQDGVTGKLNPNYPDVLRGMKEREGVIIEWNLRRVEVEKDR